MNTSKRTLSDPDFYAALTKTFIQLIKAYIATAIRLVIYLPSIIIFLTFTYTMFHPDIIATTYNASEVQHVLTLLAQGKGVLVKIFLCLTFFLVFVTLPLRANELLYSILVYFAKEGIKYPDTEL